jgi:hypothetical protein
MTRKRAVWSFNPTEKEWRLEQTNGDDIDRVTFAAYASAPDLDLHFAVGGATSALHQSENKYYPAWPACTTNDGMTIYNSRTQSLRNRTLEDLAKVSVSMAARKQGWCKYIPVGTKGMLVCHAKVTGPDNGQFLGNIYNAENLEPRLNVCPPHQALCYSC